MEADACMERVAILFAGGEAARRDPDATIRKELQKRGPCPEDANRRGWAHVFEILRTNGMQVEAVAYHDNFCSDVLEQLLQVNAVLVWHDPIVGGRDRTRLDDMLREVSRAGIYVSTHPDVTRILGTKHVLYSTRGMGWGTDTHLYRSLSEMEQMLPGRVAKSPRVLKLNRGQSGSGVWKVAMDDPCEHAGGAGGAATAPPLSSTVIVRKAARGETEQRATLGEFIGSFAPFFATHAGVSDTSRREDNLIIDQLYQERLEEGMFRCYLVQCNVAGIGHQMVNALFPGRDPGPRRYFPPTMPDTLALKRQVEQDWLPKLQELLGLSSSELPMIWDLDFFLGPRTEEGKDTYVLCEINVSNPDTFPVTVLSQIAETCKRMLKEQRTRTK